ncbi:MAG: beta-L-arabinofuranosidase domain-containing protein [Acidobacteriaceae bacterium]
MADSANNLQLTRRAFVRNLSAAGIVSLVPADSPRAHASAAALSPQQPAEQDQPGDALHKLTPVPGQQVAIEDEFWSPKRQVWQEVTIRDCFRKFENDRGGAINNFDKVRAGLTGGHAGDPWMDGLIYEMIRGSSDFLLSHPDPELEQQLDGYIARIAAAAAVRPDGYINTYTQLMEPGHEWGLHGGLQLWQHEIYNLGALIDAGVHYYRATGKAALLTAGVTIANTMTEFMGPPPKRNLVPCHPLPEEAMVRLHELLQAEPALKTSLTVPVHDTAYLQLAEFWIEDRGNNIGKPDWEKDHHAAELFVRNQEYGDGRPSWGAYAQDDAPVFEQKDIHGHAVRATLLCAGIAAAARVNDREPYRQTAIRLWENMVYRRMHITGGVGAFANEEKFGPDYTLPNDAYLETCAAVGAGFFHHNMNMAFGHARYADELERTLYNGALAGVSLAGDTYFYENPLECNTSRARWAWHECPCCPPMFLKMMGAMPSYIYATSHDSLYVNLFVGSHASIRLNDLPVEIRQATRYPWDGNVRLTVQPAHAASFPLMVRIPAWCSGESVRMNGERIASGPRVDGYLRIARTWDPGDVVELEMPMPVRPVRANPLVQADAGRVALMRGPLVYCAESVDNSAPVRTLRLSAHSPATTDFRKTLPGGVVVVQTEAAAAGDPGAGPYFSADQEIPHEPVTLTAIPYFANANRGPVDMAVWLARQV